MVDTAAGRAALESRQAGSVGRWQMAQVSSRRKSHLLRILTQARGEWQQGTQGPGELMAKQAEVSGVTTDPSEGLVTE